MIYCFIESCFVEHGILIECMITVKYCCIYYWFVEDFILIEYRLDGRYSLINHCHLEGHLVYADCDILFHIILQRGRFYSQFVHVICDMFLDIKLQCGRCYSERVHTLLCLIEYCNGECAILIVVECWLMVSLRCVGSTGHIHGKNCLVFIQVSLLQRFLKAHNQFVSVHTYKFKKLTDI